ncbi:hypothetical protein ElyMa_003316100 [Elysia marginata]|uniref:Uncharacterized protein n=1 Tax=Elysia marginata TaxID=1093978 RepID=A0AAV4JHV6_9GAST|nr:hypothetical protein ElyMa_003316100 [Elysia marginata]
MFDEVLLMVNRVVTVPEFAELTISRPGIRVDDAAGPNKLLDDRNERYCTVFCTHRLEAQQNEVSMCALYRQTTKPGSKLAPSRTSSAQSRSHPPPPPLLHLR